MAIMGKAFAKKLRGFKWSEYAYDIAENVGDANANNCQLEVPKK
jgi:hypothetical protein